MNYHDPKANRDYRDTSTVRPPGGPSNGMTEEKIGRKGQSIRTATALDNERHAIDIPTSIQDNWARGDGENQRHSYEGYKP